MSVRISMRQVAEAAGVSVGTVSRALAGDVRVVPQTRERVAAVAARLGYVPHPILATLAANRFRKDGDPALLVAILRRQAELSPLRQAAAIHGFTVRPLPDMGSTLSEFCRSVGAVGCILGVRQSGGNLRSPGHLPCVLWQHEGSILDGQVSVELNDWSRTIPETVARIRAAGWRRIGIVLTPAEPEHWADEVRRGAALACGCPLLNWTSRRTADLRAWMAEEAIEALALQTILPYQRLLATGAVPPCAVMGLWNDPEAAALAGFVSDRSLRDQVSIQQIDNALRHGMPSALRIILPARWQDGRSLPPLTSPSRR